jgi:hypothetical protein
LAEHPDPAGSGRDETQHDLQQRRLSGAVGSDDGDDAARGHFERRLGPDQPPTAGRADVFERQRGNVSCVIR